MALGQQVSDLADLTQIPSRNAATRKDSDTLKEVPMASMLKGLLAAKGACTEAYFPSFLRTSYKGVELDFPH